MSKANSEKMKEPEAEGAEINIILKLNKMHLNYTNNT